jgi:23S rRNA (cytidine1920-2'-O)/16S rRNA (cytidine1409-2'-O)-methyltransferase
MPKHPRARFVALTSLLARRHPGLDVSTALAFGRVLVDGRSITNPASRVRSDAAIRLLPERRLRGEIKMAHALKELGVPVAGRIVLDVGASAGGFTTALLDAGASRVYAVDAGVGQLVGRLRADPRVVNLEGHNLGELTTERVPEPMSLVTMDLSYLSLAQAVPQLAPLLLVPDAHLLVLVKPTFELRRPELARSPGDVRAAVDTVAAAVRRCGWTPLDTATAPRTGRGGAVEVFLHARLAAAPS